MTMPITDHVTLQIFDVRLILHSSYRLQTRIMNLANMGQF